MGHQLLFNEVKMRIAGINQNSCGDGEGVRLAIFVQGCHNHCEHCHNKHTWDPDGGKEVSINYIFDMMENLPEFFKGITLTGGEPFEQEDNCYIIAKRAHALNLTVWTYTGHCYEELAKSNHPLLDITDVLVDGPFKEEYQNVKLTYCGSSNQRIIDMHYLRENGHCYLPDGRVVLKVEKEEPQECAEKLCMVNVTSVG